MNLNERVIWIAEKMIEKMTLEERKKFIDNCIDQNGKNFITILANEPLEFVHPRKFIMGAFIFDDTPEGHNYWTEIKNRF